MKLNPEEISSIIKNKLEKYSNVSTISDIGTVMQVSDSIVRIYGLKNAKQSELLKFKNNTYGVVLNLEEENIGAILLNNNQNISEGDEVETTGEIIDIPVGNCLLGRVIDPLGNPIDGKGPLRATKYRPIENIATNVTSRQPVDTPLQTGIKAIDSMIPIGRGQRELIIGDKQTGKTSIAIDTIINQKGKNVKCIYVAIGQKSSTVANIRKTLEDSGAMDYTTIVCATASDIVSLQYIAPYAGCAIGEEYMFNGEDALIVYDDLTKHAASYRTISLLLHRPSGREAYPGDVFFLHSRLLERSAKLSSNLGGGSLTALPIVETQAGDISSYIPTNIISITDGQIYLDTELFNEGFRPAITPGLSVSRVGGNAQIKAMKELSSTIRINLAQYKELESFAKFGADLDNTSKEILKQGACIKEILKQDKCSPIDVAEQILIIYACINKHLIDLKVEDIASFEEKLINSVKNEHNEIIEEIHATKTLSQKSKKQLDIIITTVKNLFQK